MPWKTSSAMDEKLRFIFEYERDEQTMTEWCGRLGICRDTGYVWLRRYQQYGLKGLAELDRAARQHPNQRAAEVEQGACARKTRL
jgi:transposase-like protein